MKRLGVILTAGRSQRPPRPDAALLREIESLGLDDIRQFCIREKIPSSGNLDRKIRGFAEVFWLACGRWNRRQQEHTIPLFLEQLKARHPAVDFHFIPGLRS